MEQHPVPQHIASFEFKLFGNLTARQFVTLAIPMALAGVIFFSSLGPLVRYPLATIIGLIGLFVALVPVGGRPFDKWVVAFIRAIFAPTQRIWIKETKLPAFLNVVVTPPRAEEKIPQEITEKGRERLVAYLKSLPRENESPLDVREQMAIAQLDLNAEQSGVGVIPPPIIWPTNFVDRNEWPRDEPTSTRRVVSSEQKVVTSNVRAMPNVAIKPLDELPSPSIRQVPKIAIHSKPYVIPGVVQRLEKITSKSEAPQVKMTVNHLASDTNFAIDNIISVVEPDNKIRLVRGVGSTRVRKLHFAPPANFDLSKLPIRGEGRFEISDELKRRFNFSESTPSVVLPTAANAKVMSVAVGAANLGSEISRAVPKHSKNIATAAGNKMQTVAKPVKVTVESDLQSRFSVSDKKQHNDAQGANMGAAIIPLTDVANVLSGLIADDQGIPVEGAVLVVRDASGLPVRALKTNKLGQFLSATPLTNGVYTIEIESEAVAFAPTAVTLSGEVLPPLGIRGQMRAN